MIDPTFAAHVRAYLRAVADGNPDASPQELLDAIAAGVEEAPTRPRRLKGRGASSRALPAEKVATPAGADDPRPRGAKVTGSEYVGPVDCPDCGMGLTSRGDDMICPRLPRDLKLAGTGGIIACGVRHG